MAWFAECKRRKWRRIVELDMIAWYRQKLYAAWWNSLTEEQRVNIEERRKREHVESLQQLANMYRMYNHVTYDVCHLNPVYERIIRSGII